MDKIICVGKNYLEHAKELGDAIPEKPVLFLKPASVLKQAQEWHETVPVHFPENYGEVHYECEIVLRLKQGGYQLSTIQIEDYVDAVTLGLDMTLRTLQATLKKNGHPWTTGKVFPDAAIIGPWILANNIDYLHEEFSLSLNKEIRQRGNAQQMMMKPVDLICYISQFFPLCEGDLIFTGTPAGVGQVNRNDVMTLNWKNYSYNVEWK